MGTAEIVGMDKRARFFFATTAAITVFTVLHMLPLPLLHRAFFPVHAASYRFALINGLLAHGYRFYYSLELPKPLTTESVKSQLVPNLRKSNSFLSALYCLLFLSGRPVNMALVPIAATALYQFFTLLNKHYATHPLYAKNGRGEKAFAYLQANMDKALVTATLSEVMVGFMLLGGLLTPGRQLARTFMYWNLYLRARYHCPDNTVFRIKFTHGNVAFYHNAVWAQLHSFAAPAMRYLPALGKVEKAATTWFRGY